MQVKLNRALPWIYLAFLLSLHSLATWLWLSMDNRPPLWDMALHQTKGLAFHDYYVGSGAGLPGSWWSISGAYPPFYHHLLVLAFFLGRESYWAVWANLFATIVLVVVTFLLGRCCFSTRTGLLASTALLGFPFMAWISHETVIDYTLAAVVLVAIYFLQRCEGFTRRRTSLGFGLAAGVAALTKWIGPLFLVLPALWSWRRYSGSDVTARTRNFLDASIVAVGIAMAWYLVKLPEVLDFLRSNSLIGAAEGEPAVFSFQSIIYYLRLLEGEQLQAAFFLLFCIGLLAGLKRRNTGLGLLLCWILSGYAGLTLLRTKDPRFTLPFLPAVALVSVSWVESVRSSWRRTAAAAGIVLLSSGHFLLSSFGSFRIPEKIVMMSGYRGSYSWDWTLYSQNYQGLLGAPQVADWPQMGLLSRIVTAPHRSRRLRLGVVPDLPRFNHENVRLAAAMHYMPVDVLRIGVLDTGTEKLMAELDYIVVAEGEQGMEWSTRGNRQINEYIFARPELFRIDSFARVPNGPALRLYRVVRS